MMIIIIDMGIIIIIIIIIMIVILLFMAGTTDIWGSALKILHNILSPVQVRPNILEISISIVFNLQK